MLLKMTFYCSFLHFDARLTFPQARLRQSQPRLQEYWFFVLGAIFNSELSFSFVDISPFSDILNENTPYSLLISFFERNSQSKRFSPQMWRKNFSSTSTSEGLNWKWSRSKLLKRKAGKLIFQTSCINEVWKET